MDTILISPVTMDGHLLAGVKVEAAFGGGAYKPADDTYIIKLPDSPRPLELKLRITGDAKLHFVVELEATYAKVGELEVRGELAYFAPPRAAVVDGHAMISLVVFLSRLRDATADAETALRNAPDARPGLSPPENYSVVTDADIGNSPRHVLADPPIGDDHQLAFDKESPGSLNPDAQHIVFELKVDTAPKLISVTWPRSVERAIAAPAPDVLVYFHHDVNQNWKQGYYHGRYPYSFDYLYLHTVAFNWYEADPLLSAPFKKGIALQIFAAGRSVISVVPVNSLAAEIGVFASASSMEIVLREIVGFVLRRERVFETPTLGRVGLASFSAGNRRVQAFLKANKDHSFCRETVREVYGFEPPLDNIANWLHDVTAWMTTGADDKCARIYCLRNHPKEFGKFLGLPGDLSRRTPHFAESEDGRRTASVIDTQEWGSVRVKLWAQEKLPRQKTEFQEGHQLTSALLLTHAMRKSGFRKM